MHAKERIEDTVEDLDPEMVDESDDALDEQILRTLVSEIVRNVISRDADIGVFYRCNRDGRRIDYHTQRSSRARR